MAHQIICEKNIPVQCLVLCSKNYVWNTLLEELKYIKHEPILFTQKNVGLLLQMSPIRGTKFMTPSAHGPQMGTKT